MQELIAMRYRRLKQQRDDENERWQQAWKETKERHRLELRRLHGDPAAMQSDRQDQFSYYGERVLDDLLALQKHLRDVKERTVDTVVLDGEDLEGLDHRPAADPTDGARVMATTDAFGSEADALEADLAGDVASGAVTLGAEEAPKAPAETPKAPAETPKATAETTPAVAETPPAAAETPPAAAEMPPAVAETPPAAAETPPAAAEMPRQCKSSSGMCSKFRPHQGPLLLSWTMDRLLPGVLQALVVTAR